MHLECQIGKKSSCIFCRVILCYFLKGVCFYFICVDICLHANMYMVCMSNSGHTVEEGIGSLGTEFQVTQPIMWALWTKAEYSARATSAGTCWAASLVPGCILVWVWCSCIKEAKEMTSDFGMLHIIVRWSHTYTKRPITKVKLSWICRHLEIENLPV